MIKATKCPLTRFLHPSATHRGTPTTRRMSYYLACAAAALGSIADSTCSATDTNVDSLNEFVLFDEYIHGKGYTIPNNSNLSFATEATFTASESSFQYGKLSPFSDNTRGSIVSPFVFGVTSGTIWASGGFTFTINAPIPVVRDGTGGISFETFGILDDGIDDLGPTNARFQMKIQPEFGVCHDLDIYPPVSICEPTGKFAFYLTITPIPESPEFTTIAGIGIFLFAAYCKWRDLSYPPG